MAAPDLGPTTPDTNRLRRLGDAAKLVPLFAAVLMLVPVLWSAGSATSSAMVYVFSVWGLLIVLIGFLSRALSRFVRTRTASTPRREP